jgi:hypothetical protein
VPGSTLDRACAEPGCAAQRASGLEADAAFLCTLARLGRKLVVTLQLVDASGRVVWNHRVSASRLEELDQVAGRLAGAAARALADVPRAEPAISRHETEASHDDAASREAAEPDETPHKKRGWSSKGPRAGALYPVGDSYAGTPRMTSVAYAWRYQTPSFNVETVPILGLAWGGDLERDHGKARDWTLLDVYATWTPAKGDVAPYAGVGMGLHGVRLERDGTGVPFAGRRDQTSTALSLALGGGVMLLRTYDFQICLDLRYHLVMNDFEEVGGDGARGFALTFGLHHR